MRRALRWLAAGVIIVAVAFGVLFAWAWNDRDETFEIASGLAESGDPRMQWYLSYLYDNGEHTRKDPALAAQWLRKAAENGHPYAQARLGFRFDRGDAYFPRDARQAAAWLKKAADQGDAPAQWRIAQMLASGTGIERDDVAATEYARKSADQGFVGGMAVYALRLKDGRGVAKNPEQAVVWMRKLAEAGDIDMQALLASALEKGEGVPKDEVQAVAWYRKAVAGGDPYAQVMLADMLQEGRGTERNVAEAELLYRRSLEPWKGWDYRAYAAKRLGFLLGGTPSSDGFKNPTAMAQLFSRAANLGDSHAAVMYAELLSEGHGVPKDEAQALALLQATARKGYGRALESLGIAYANGTVVPQDLVMSSALFRIAAKQGATRSEGYLARVEKKLSSGQKRQAAELAEKWKVGTLPQI